MGRRSVSILAGPAIIIIAIAVDERCAAQEYAFNNPGQALGLALKCKFATGKSLAA